MKKQNTVKHMLTSLAYLAVVALGLNGFDIAAKVAYGAGVELFVGEGEVMTFVYAIACVVGIAWLTFTVFSMFSAYTASWVGKPLLEKMHRELETKWHEEKSAIENKLIEYANVYEDYVAVNEQLAEELRVANEELKVLRGPLELGKAKHFDDQALDWFVNQMRGKLARKRLEGRSGWHKVDEVSHDTLEELILEEASSSNTNYVNVANYAMFCWVRDAYPEECEEAVK